jgi:hypothetical protein
LKPRIVEKDWKKNPKVSLLSGFGLLNKNDATPQSDITDEKFPHLDFMKSFNLQSVTVKKAPHPKVCLIKMINIQLKTVPEGKRINFTVSYIFY